MESDLAAMMADFVSVAGRRAPLYQRIAAGVSSRPDVLALLAEAPPATRLPVTLFAAVHALLLADMGTGLKDNGTGMAAGTDPADGGAGLAAWYPDIAPFPRTDDPTEAFVTYCMDRREEISALVRTRTPQTNEVGRCALLVLGAAQVGAEVGPLAHLDVGASAGLNLLLDRYGYDFAGHRLGPDRLVLSTGIAAPGRRLPSGLPRVSSRLGLDCSPVDLTRPADVLWLEACVWPDQTDRFRRLTTAIAMAREEEVQVIEGDAVDDLDRALGALGEGHPLITTSWVLSYLGPDERARFVATLDRIGSERDLSWVCAEAPSYAPGLPCPSDLVDSPLTLLSVHRWRSGRRHDDYLASCHQHGYWLTWLS